MALAAPAYKEGLGQSPRTICCSSQYHQKEVRLELSWKSHLKPHSHKHIALVWPTAPAVLQKSSFTKSPFFQAASKQSPVHKQRAAGSVASLNLSRGLLGRADDGSIQTGSSVATDEKTVLRNLSIKEMVEWMKHHGQTPRQAEHVWKWLYKDLAKDAFDVPGAPGINKAFRHYLALHAEFDVLRLVEIKKAADGTTKVVFETRAGGRVETVLIPTPGRNTVCVSSQVGCAMNCQFCYTGRIGLKANLSAGEIVEQLVIMRRLFTDEFGPINNVVFMGMGEPMHNLDNVVKAVDIMVHQQGLHVSHKKVSVSTSGLVPQIRRFCRESPASLAVSLNATTDEVRDWIMPVNRQYNLEALIGCLTDQFPRTNGGQDKVLFEYVLLKGINDSPEDARRLIELVKPVPCRVNLIGFNPHAGSSFQPVPKPQMLEFFRVLADAGVVVTLRESRGDDQMAACGQLGELGDNPAPLLTPPARFRNVSSVVPC